MNRKQKIIVSVVGITIVMLALLGITYAYYLTRIEGNTNTNSISVTTADLKLKYDDNSSYINLTNIMPGVITDGEGDNPKPKVFTVTNEGTSDIEYSVGMDEVTNTLTRTQDLTYSITCVEKLIDAADTTYTACATTPSNSGEYPKTNSYLFTNQIKQDCIQKYTVVVSYVNLDEDQSIDMGSTIKGRMQIYSLPETIDIIGTVAGVSFGDYVQINSNPKTSFITSDGTYKLIGVGPGVHTLKVMNGDTVKGTKEIIVKQGTSSGISDNVITFTKYDRVATINVTSVSTNLGVNITDIVDDRVSLKDEIIANAQQAANENSTTRTIYSETPLTTPALDLSAFKYIDKIGSTKNVYNTYSTSSSKYYTYGDTYEYSSNKYTIKNSDGSVVKSVKGTSSLVGKYIVDYYGSSSSTAESATNLSTIYYVSSVDSSSISYIKLSSGVASNEYYYTYGDTYDFNELTGEYTIKNSDGSALKAVKYNENYEILKDKYIVSASGRTSTTPVSGENKTTIYKVSSDSTDEILKYYSISKSSENQSLESVLSITQDNYGTSYYFRGGVQDNYVTFSNKCWRIVRIQGDGSIKLALESQSVCSENMTRNFSLGTSFWGYKVDNDNYIGDYKNSSNGMKSKLTSWLNATNSNGERKNITAKAEKLLKTEEWCLGNVTNTYAWSSPYGLLGTTASENAASDTRFLYETARNLYGKGVTANATLICNGETDSSKIGALTSDEVAFAGAKVDSLNSWFYLYHSDYYWWTLSRFYFNGTYEFASSNNFYGLSSTYVSDIGDVRPAITLISGVKIKGGDGTKGNSYIIDER